MSYDYDDDEQNQGETPKALRDLVKKLQRDLEKVTEERDGYASKAKAADLSAIFTKKSVPPRIQRWMKDVDATEEAVDKWLAENGEDFGYKPGGDATPAATTETPEGQNVSPAEAPAPVVPSVLTPEDVAELQRLQGLLAGGVGQTQFSDAAHTAVATVESQLGADASFEDAVAALRAQGIDMQSSR